MLLEQGLFRQDTTHLRVNQLEGKVVAIAEAHFSVAVYGVVAILEVRWCYGEEGFEAFEVACSAGDDYGRRVISTRGVEQKGRFDVLYAGAVGLFHLAGSVTLLAVGRMS